MIFLTQYKTACTTEKELFDDIIFPQKVHWFPESYKRAKSGMIYAPHRVAEKVLDEQTAAWIRENPVGKTAFILASGNSHFAGINPRNRPETRLSYEYRFLPLTLTQVYAGRLAQSLNASDHIVTDATACASSLKVMMDVQTLIKMYGFKRVIVLSVEDQVSNSVLEFFGEAGATLSWKQEQEGMLPSAFDSVNQGFNVGQGACFAVFEDESVVKDPKCALLGSYTASEPCSNAIGQLESGEGFKRAIEGAIFCSQETPSQIKIVKTHGTGTISNNVAERAAISSMLTDFVATSYKQRIGHTMGVSGLLETLLLLDDMGRGIIPGIPNRTEDDSVFLSKDIPAIDGDILSLAAGMGNVYSAAIFRRV